MTDKSLFNVPPTDAPESTAQIVERLRTGQPPYVSTTLKLHAALLSAWEYFGPLRERFGCPVCGPEAVGWYADTGTAPDGEPEQIQVECQSCNEFNKARADVLKLLGG